MKIGVYVPLGAHHRLIYGAHRKRSVGFRELFSFNGLYGCTPVQLDDELRQLNKNLILGEVFTFRSSMYL